MTVWQNTRYWRYPLPLVAAENSQHALILKASQALISEVWPNRLKFAHAHYPPSHDLPIQLRLPV